ncbi:hypothetical protein ACIQU6_15570 [Streptomyces sp. NPDC090442]|uniref:hypothetical protein n=1 Tax=Streptomyces sp. NPDC090442 TaxID=3365962 RepID=UPI0038144472
MLLLLGGRKRTTSGYARLGAQSGRPLNTAHHLPGGATVMEFWPGAGGAKGG